MVKECAGVKAIIHGYVDVSRSGFCPNWLLFVRKKSASFLEFARSSQAHITSSHMHSHRNVKECTETAKFMLCKQSANRSGHVPHVWVNAKSARHVGSRCLDCQYLAEGVSEDCCTNECSGLQSRW